MTGPHRSEPQGGAVTMERKPFVVARGVEPRWYPGGLFTFLANSEQTGGQFGLFEALVGAGEEIPGHTHTREDEAFFILEGAMRGEIAGAPFQAHAGDFVYLPRGLSHTWRVESERLRVLVLITPAGFEQAFVEFSQPALAPELPPAEFFPGDLMERIIERENELGVIYDFQR